MSQEFNKMQKCMFGVHLKKCSEEWAKENPDTIKEANTVVAGLSKPTLYRAYRGEITDDNMRKVSERLNKPLEEMIKFNLESLWIHIQTRIKEDSKFTKQMTSLFMLFYFMVLYIINNSMLNLLLIFIFAIDLLQNISNLWRIELTIRETEEKAIHWLKYLKIVLIIIVLILGVQNQF